MPSLSSPKPILSMLERIAISLERLAAPSNMAKSSASSLEEEVIAWTWEHTATSPHAGHFLPILHPHLIAFHQLQNIEPQKVLIQQNTRQFLANAPANNVLLTGARGTGKSSLVRACLDAYHAQGLRLIEVEKSHLDDLPTIVDQIRSRPERFIIFCDDLSFEEDETGYKGLKTVLDGSIAGKASNVLIYATSNRRHLIAEQVVDNLSYRHSEDGELHPGDVIEEKMALADRFGLWISFLSFTQEQYLQAVKEWLLLLGLKPDAIEASRQEALQWAIQRGSRSGRTAWQFACDYVGRQKISL